MTSSVESAAAVPGLAGPGFEPAVRGIEDHDQHDRPHQHAHERAEHQPAEIGGDGEDDEEAERSAGQAVRHGGVLRRSTAAPGCTQRAARFFGAAFSGFSSVMSALAAFFLPVLTRSRLWRSASIRLTTFGGASSSVATTSSPAIFASMIRCSSSWYSSRYSSQFSVPFEVLDHLLGELDLVRLDLGRDGLQLVDVVHAAHFLGVPQRVHHQPVVLRQHGDQVLAAVERQLADAGLALHALAHDREGVGAPSLPSGAR